MAGFRSSILQCEWCFRLTNTMWVAPSTHWVLQPMWVLQMPTGTSRKPVLMTKNPSGVNKETQRGCIRIFSGALWCAALPQGTQVQVVPQFNFLKFEITNDTFGDDRSIKMCIVLEDMKKTGWWTWRGRGFERGSMTGYSSVISPTSTNLHHLFASHMHQQSDKGPALKKPLAHDILVDRLIHHA